MAKNKGTGGRGRGGKSKGSSAPVEPEVLPKRVRDYDGNLITIEKETQPNAGTTLEGYIDLSGKFHPLERSNENTITINGLTYQVDDYFNPSYDIKTYYDLEFPETFEGYTIKRNPDGTFSITNPQGFPEFLKETEIVPKYQIAYDNNGNAMFDVNVGKATLRTKNGDLVEADISPNPNNTDNTTLLLLEQPDGEIQQLVVDNNKGILGVRQVKPIRTVEDIQKIIRDYNTTPGKPYIEFKDRAGRTVRVNNVSTSLLTIPHLRTPVTFDQYVEAILNGTSPEDFRITIGGAEQDGMPRIVYDNSYQRPYWSDGTPESVRPFDKRVEGSLAQQKYKTKMRWIKGTTIGGGAVGIPMVLWNLLKPVDPNKLIDNIIKNGLKTYDSIFSTLPEDLEVLDSNKYYENQ